jgi:pectin methylesterase-like acyl-CoA thioesterase
MIRSYRSRRSHFSDGTLLVGIGLHVAFAAGAIAQPVPAALTAAAWFPAPGARDVCPDTPLRITFAGIPQKGSGKIRVVDAANDAVVQTIDVAIATRTRTIGGLPNFMDYPVIISGNQASLYLPSNTVGYNKTYDVKVDVGAFRDSTGNPLDGGPGATPWRFTTRTAPPPAGTGRLTVAADGSGDFATVQGALDFVPEGNTAPTTIFIRRGIYNEIVCFTRKNAITLLGEDRKKTVIAYANNERFNGNAGGNPFAPGAVAPGAAQPRLGGAVYRRGLLLAHRVEDLVIANLTLRNTTPQGGSQAEAIILNGTSSARAIVTSVDLSSFQDTLQINGQAYVSDCSIEGDVDFMWGTGPCFFESCTTRSLRSNAYFTQIRNPPTHHGYVYKNCTFGGAPGVTGNFLSRIAPVRFPASEMVMIDCVLTGAVGAVAWRLDQATEAPGVHFWEFGSHDADGKPLDTSRRLAVSRQLTLPEDEETISAYSDPNHVLGGNWSPALAPIITTQPSPLAVVVGRKAAFEVAVAAVPHATYQWQKDGENLAGATSATYAIDHVEPIHSGTYTVVISNRAGKVTSQPARLSLDGQE